MKVIEQPLLLLRYLDRQDPVAKEKSTIYQKNLYIRRNQLKNIALWNIRVFHRKHAGMSFTSISTEKLNFHYSLKCWPFQIVQMRLKKFSCLLSSYLSSKLQFLKSFNLIYDVYSLLLLFFSFFLAPPPLPHHHNFAPLDPPFFAGGGIIIKRNRKEIFSNISRGLIFTEVLIPRISLYLEYLSMLLRPPFFYATINHIFSLGTAAAESEHNYRKKNHNI